MTSWINDYNKIITICATKAITIQCSWILIFSRIIKVILNPKRLRWKHQEVPVELIKTLLFMSIHDLIIWYWSKHWALWSVWFQADSSFHLFDGGGSKLYRDLSRATGGFPALTRSYSLAIIGWFWKSKTITKSPYQIKQWESEREKLRLGFRV